MPYKDPNKKKAHEKKYYQAHKEEHRIVNKRWRERNKEHIKEYYTKNKEKFAKRRKNWAVEKRKKVLIYYSGNPPRCACCGESIYGFLTIDHINKDGADHRRKIANGKAHGGFQIINWIVRNNYPKGFQVLCMNCNWASRNLEVCPHKIKGQNNK